jgi:tetratricopeptide (TPR) repeat protein
MLNNLLRIAASMLIAVSLAILPLQPGITRDVDRLIRMAEEAGSDSLKIQLYKSLGEMLMDHHLDSALMYYQYCASLAEKQDDDFFRYLFVQCLTQIAVIYTIKGEFIHALEYNQQSINLLTELSRKDPADMQYRFGIGAAQANIGAIFFHQKNFSRALEYWEQAEEVYKGAGDSISAALLSNNTGLIYLELKDYPNALLSLEKSLSFFLREGTPEYIAMCYTNLGDIYSAMGLFAKALESLDNSRKFKEKAGDMTGLAICYHSIAKVCYNMGDHKRSVEFAAKSLELAAGIKDDQEMVKAYELLAGNYAALKNYEKAWSYQVLLKQMSDSIFNAEKHRQFAEMETKYRTGKKEDELILLRQQEKNRKLTGWLLVTGIMLIIAVSSFFIIFIVQKRKKEKKLFLADRQLADKENQLIRGELVKKEMLADELNREIEYKARQLTTTALNMMQKNKLLLELGKAIDDIAKNSSPEGKERLTEVKKHLRKSLRTEKDWEVFRLYFEQVNKGFFERLASVNPALNTYELRYCALIRLNLNIKETAAALNLSPNSIKSARHRLKKKLGLQPEEDLYDFIRKISCQPG